MKYNPKIHHRHSIRLRGYDYASSGAYFITICTHDRQHLFGDIVDGKMAESQLGQVARQHWQRLSRHHRNLAIDEFVVMPDHFHGILTLQEPLGTPISEIIRGFKTFSAREINRIRQKQGTPVWQRNYYERIIRSQPALNRVRQYIIENPKNWRTR
jgi:putative transposase